MTSSSLHLPRRADGARVREIKHAGYGLMVRRTPQVVEIKTGADSTKRFPLITDAAGRLRVSVIGGSWRNQSEEAAGHERHPCLCGAKNEVRTQPTVE